MSARERVVDVMVGVVGVVVGVVIWAFFLWWVAALIFGEAPFQVP